MTGAKSCYSYASCLNLTRCLSPSNRLPVLKQIFEKIVHFVSYGPGHNLILKGWPLIVDGCRFFSLLFCFHRSKQAHEDLLCKSRRARVGSIWLIRVTLSRGFGEGNGGWLRAELARIDEAKQWKSQQDREKGACESTTKTSKPNNNHGEILFGCSSIGCH